MPAHTKIQPKSSASEKLYPNIKLNKASIHNKAAGSKMVSVKEANSCLKRAMERVLISDSPINKKCDKTIPNEEEKFALPESHINKTKKFSTLYKLMVSEIII